MKGYLGRSTPGRRGYIWRLFGEWYSASTSWDEGLGIRTIDPMSAKAHNTIEAAYDRAASLTTKENTDV
jgi:hypothetical protein